MLFNDALDTFYFTVIWSRHMVQDHSDSERATPDYQQGFFCMPHPTDRITHTMTFVTPVVEQEIA